MSELVPKPLRSIATFLFDKVHLRIEVRPLKPRRLARLIDERFGYQVRYVKFHIKPTDRVLDVGSGGYPVPHATVLVERFLEPSQHRHEQLARAGKPLVLADIHTLPFGDKCFDFVYCSHLLEHVDNPLKACAEIMRVGRRGFVETPTMGKDALFAWAKDMHKWHVVACGQNLCFFEYSPRQVEGIRSSVWRDIIFSKWYHPLQEVFYQNQDVFNVMFSWFNIFSVFVFHLDGSVEALNAKVRYRNVVPRA